MKKMAVAGFVSAVVVVSAAVLYGSTKLSDQLLAGSKSDTTKCSKTGEIKHLTIQDNKMQPTHIQAAQCDKLVVTNTDNMLRDIAFGTHDHHIAYGGVSEKTLNQGESFEVSLQKTGSYIVHDHLHDEVQATFTVVNAP
jgi:plastocyanin